LLKSTLSYLFIYSFKRKSAFDAFLVLMHDFRTIITRRSFLLGAYGRCRGWKLNCCFP